MIYIPTRDFRSSGTRGRFQFLVLRILLEHRILVLIWGLGFVFVVICRVVVMGFVWEELAFGFEGHVSIGGEGCAGVLRGDLWY